MWRPEELGEAADRIRSHPEIRDVTGVLADGGRLYVLVEQQGFAYGTVLRDIVLDEIGPDHPDMAVAVVRDLPRIEGIGEVDNAASVELARRMTARPTRIFRYEPPASDQEKALASLLLEILPVDRVSMTDSLPLLGADSLMLVELTAALGERFDVKVDAMELFEVGSVRGLTDLVFAQVP
jgi:acyl carrier protein